MEADLVEVTAIKVEPNDCPLEANLSVVITFTVKKPIPKAFWKMTFVFDFAYQKHVVGFLFPFLLYPQRFSFYQFLKSIHYGISELKQSDVKSYTAGEHTETFTVDKIDLSFVFLSHFHHCITVLFISLSGVKHTTALNMGLLSLSFFTADNTEPLLDVNMATEISKKKGTGQLMRSIMNPLE